MSFLNSIQTQSKKHDFPLIIGNIIMHSQMEQLKKLLKLISQMSVSTILTMMELEQSMVVLLNSERG
jgi:hypothetical protein